MVIKRLMISNISICRWSRCCNPKRFLAFANGNGSKNCEDYYDFWLVSCIQMILKFAFGMCCSVTYFNDIYIYLHCIVFDLHMIDIYGEFYTSIGAFVL